MNLKDLYIDFFISKGHKHIPSAPVVPENDASVLFNTAGMQPLVPYLLGKKHPYGTRLVNYQKCIRTNDLDSIGDVTHHTFFEMLGNWSLGDYFKEESIGYSFEFLTKVLNIPLERLAITVFEGDLEIPRDEVSANIWKSLGINDDRIAYLGKEDNFWIAGEEGPCGGDTEIFYFRSADEIPSKFDPNDDRWVEIWNNVFMEFNKVGNKIEELNQKNVDTGMGYERVVAILEGHTDNYLSSVWKDVITKIEDISNLSYKNNEESMRIIADHIRTAVFIISDKAMIRPSNTDQGYILRRLIRRAIRHAKKLNININSNFEEEIAKEIMHKYEDYYSEIKENKQLVLDVLKQEKEKFNKTIETGLKEFDKSIKNKDTIDGKTAFRLYDTFGFPIELTEELAKENNLNVDIEGFNTCFKEHQEKSRAGAATKFKGGLAGNNEITTQYHTATHLLNAALKEVLGSHVHQMGSNITEERLRFDFSHDVKVDAEQLKEIEKLVNGYISNGLEVTYKEMTKEEAIKTGAECMFLDKYPDIVNVYFIGDISKELCGGPHVKNTNELGKFVIKKEEASSAGVRRIKAILEK